MHKISGFNSELVRTGFDVYFTSQRRVYKAQNNPEEAEKAATRKVNGRRLGRRKEVSIQVLRGVSIHSLTASRPPIS